MALLICLYAGDLWSTTQAWQLLLRPRLEPPGERDQGQRYERRGRVSGVPARVATLNPKTALFFFAFLPQFIDPSKGSVSLQLLTLGCIFVAMAIFTDSIYALLAGTAGQLLKGTGFFLRAERYVIGSVYIGLGLTAALTDAKHQ